MTATGEAVGLRGPGERGSRLNRRLKWLYWVASTGLAPWIVYLYVTQVPHHRAQQLRALAVGLILAMMVGLLGAAWLCWRRSRWTTIAASFAGTTTFIAAWFRGLTHSGGSRWSESLPVFLTVVTFIIVVCILAVRNELATRLDRPPRWLPIALLVAGPALVPSLLIVLAAAPDVQVAYHLHLAWTGLDLFELLAMATTGFALHRGSPSVIATATVTGALLICDAWINVIPASGTARWEGIALVFVELPLAALSVWVAIRASGPVFDIHR